MDVIKTDQMDIMKIQRLGSAFLVTKHVQSDLDLKLVSELNETEISHMPLLTLLVIKSHE